MFWANLEYSPLLIKDKWNNDTLQIKASQVFKWIKVLRIFFKHLKSLNVSTCNSAEKRVAVHAQYFFQGLFFDALFNNRVI